MLRIEMEMHMGREILMATLVAALLLLSGGCERNTATNSKEGGSAQVAAQEKHDSLASRDHAAGEGHDDADTRRDEPDGHDHGDDDAHRGERYELGAGEIAGLTVQVVQCGRVVSGAAELVFEIEVEGSGTPAAVRLLVRSAEGSESLKVKANKVGDHTYDAHVLELPDSLGDGSVVVVEIETTAVTEGAVFALRT